MSDDLIKLLRSPATVFYEYAADNGSLLKQAAGALEARGKRIDELENRLIDNAARIAELEAALKPFADAAAELEDKEHGAIWESPAAMCITASDLRNCQRLLDGSRAARAAMGEKE